MGEWREISLFDAIELQRGFDLPEAQRRDGHIPVVASTSIVGWHDEARVAGPGVVIGRSGSIGGGRWVEDDFWPLNTTLWVKDFRGNDPHFVYYMLRSIDFSRFNAGSGVPTLNRNHLTSVDVLLPALAEQRAIAGVLGALDDKIESNRRTASTCIQLAQLLLSAGNEQIRVGQCAAIEKGLSYKGAGLAEKGSGTPMFNLGNFGTSGWLDRTSTKYYSGAFKDRHTVRTGDLIVANTDLTQQRVILGRPALVPPLPDTGIITHHVFAVRCQNTAIRLALWAQLNGNGFRERAEGYATGTTVASMPSDALADFVVEVPSDSQVAEAEALIERAWAAESESETLVATRDTLLPELLSGRLRVREAEEMVGSV